MHKDSHTHSTIWRGGGGGGGRGKRGEIGRERG